MVTIYSVKGNKTLFQLLVARGNDSFIERSTHSRDSIHSGLGTSEMTSILRPWEFFYLVTVCFGIESEKCYQLLLSALTSVRGQ